MRRVNEVMRQVVSGMITSDLSDPRLNMVTVNSVDTSPDLRHAKVLITVLGDDDAREDALAGLRGAHGLIQGRVARETSMKHTPTLTFEYDESVETGLRIAALLDSDGDQEQDGGRSEPGS